MKNLYISIFFASILLITSCEGGAGSGPAPATTPCIETIVIPAGRSYSVTAPDGTLYEGIAPEGGMPVNYPCGGTLSQ